MIGKLLDRLRGEIQDSTVLLVLVATVSLAWSLSLIDGFRPVIAAGNLVVAWVSWRVAMYYYLGVRRGHIERTALVVGLYWVAGGLSLWRLYWGIQRLGEFLAPNNAVVIWMENNGSLFTAASMIVAVVGYAFHLRPVHEKAHGEGWFIAYTARVFAAFLLLFSAIIASKQVRDLGSDIASLREQLHSRQGAWGRFTAEDGKRHEARMDLLEQRIIILEAK